MKSIKQYINELLFLLYGDKDKLLFIITMFIVSSLLDIAGLGLIFPFFILIMEEDISHLGYLPNLLDYINIPIIESNIIIFISILLVTVFFVKTVTGLYIERKIISFGQGQRARLKQKLMYTYQNLKLDDFNNHNSSHYINMIVKVTDSYGSAIQAILQLMSNGIIGAAILFFLIWQSPLVLLPLGVLGLSTIAFDFLYKNKIRKFGKKITKYTDNTIKAINEGLHGLKDIRILGKELYFYKIIKENSNKSASLQSRYQTLMKVPRYLNELSVVVSIVLFVLIAIQYDYSFYMLLPIMTIFGVAAIRLIPIISYFSVGINELRVDRYPVSLLYNELHSPNSTIKIGKYYDAGCFKSISLNDVNFSFSKSNIQVLFNISMSIYQGEIVGIVGASGSGKTTLINILLGLYKPNSGTILYNERDLLHNILPLWHSHIAYLPQNTFLIDNTLRSNIALGVDDSEIDDEKLYSSIEKAQLVEVVEQLPNGVYTRIGEKGSRLSGGQGQRVAIARAFYHGRDIFVMDEVTNSLDQDMEDKVSKEISLLKGSVTSIVIMHHLNKNIDFDRVYKIENGRLILQ